MKNQLTYFFIILCFSLTATAQSEADYQYLIHKELGGETEVSVTSGRVDLVTENNAWEIDWANKWKHAIGQAIWYGLQTNKKPGIILIQSNTSEFKYVQQLYSALAFAGLSDKIDVKIYPSDFNDSSTNIQNIYQSNTSSSFYYWLSINSKKRHNINCYQFEKSKGRYCKEHEGIAAKCCGG